MIPPWTHLCWAWQRARRGWSDDDLWDLDAHIARILATALPEFQRRNIGHPCFGDSPPQSCKGCDCQQRWDRELRRGAKVFARIVAGDYVGDEGMAQEVEDRDKAALWLRGHLWHLWI